jgi:hypothetical protein
MHPHGVPRSNRVKFYVSYSVHQTGASIRLQPTL